MKPSFFSISTVERETGLTKDVLRKWETRYGFPLPIRNPNGERSYSKGDLDRLLAIKRLLDTGARPSQVVPLSLKRLATLAVQRSEAAVPDAHDELQNQVWKALKSPDPSALKNALTRALMSEGLLDFVLARIPRLNEMVGMGWANGTLAIHEEHLYSESIRSLLLDALGRLQSLPNRPRVLFSTPPDERHDLGTLMVQSVLALSGAHCISLGPETPATELTDAAQRHRVQIVALTFSIAYPARRIAPFLEQVRAGLPDGIQVWSGGAGMDRLRRQLPGIHTFASLEQAAAALLRFPLTGSAP